LAVPSAISFGIEIAKLDSVHYPERIGMILIINAPKIFSFAWNAVVPFLDDVTRAKIKIISDRVSWEPVLRDNIDLDQIPINYGGTAPNFSLEEKLSTLEAVVNKDTKTSECNVNPEDSQKYSLQRLDTVIEREEASLNNQIVPSKTEEVCYVNELVYSAGGFCRIIILNLFNCVMNLFQVVYMRAYLQ
jgi:hypothetical protein